MEYKNNKSKVKQKTWLPIKEKEQRKLLPFYQLAEKEVVLRIHNLAQTETTLFDTSEKKWAMKFRIIT